MSSVLLQAGVARSQRVNEPLAFDYQERAGFSLAMEDRDQSIEEFEEFLADAIQHAPVAVQEDLQDVIWSVNEVAPEGRDRIRVLRFFTDQPVIVSNGFVLVPDSSTPDAVPSQEEIDRCNVGPADSLPDRCISLHRDHEQNRSLGFIGVALMARTVIFRGDNATGGLSVFTVTENLIMEPGARLDLSASQEPAPTFDDTERVIAQQLPGSPVDTLRLAEQAEFLEDPGSPPQWSFPSHPDLQWQFARAEELAPSEYSWEDDPCRYKEIELLVDKEVRELENNAAAREICYRLKERRGLSGLPGGNWLALSYRATAVRARSLGQPGGDGGSGLDARTELTCGDPDLEDQKCAYIRADCAAYGVPSTEACDPDQRGFMWSPPDPHNYYYTCTGCQQARCHKKYPELNYQDCAVTCQTDALSKGSQGAPGGPGGPPGIIRVVSATRTSRCSPELSSATLLDPLAVHQLDERCVNAELDDGDADLVDCDSPWCTEDPNVTTCATSEMPMTAGSGVFTEPLLADTLAQLTATYPDASAWAQFNPIARGRYTEQDPDTIVVRAGVGS